MLPFRSSAPVIRSPLICEWNSSAQRSCQMAWCGTSFVSWQSMSKASEEFLAPRPDDPHPLLSDLKNMLRQHARSHPRHLQIQLGPSEVGHPCSRKLAQGLLELPQINPQYDPLPSYIGVAAHKAMEDAAALDNA